MNILLLGSGGREHALSYKLIQSELCSRLFVAPGNAGTKQTAENVAIEVNDFDKIKEFCLKESIKMVVVGPEDPLVNGIYDYFKSDSQLNMIQVVGPSKYGAQLEGSKEFAKEFLVKNNIPTAAYGSFTKDNIAEGFAFLEKL